MGNVFFFLRDLEIARPALWRSTSGTIAPRLWLKLKNGTMTKQSLQTPVATCNRYQQIMNQLELVNLLSFVDHGNLM